MAHPLRNRSVYLILVLALLPIFVATGFSVLAFHYSLKAGRRTVLLQEDIRRLELLLSKLNDAEMGARGFALTEASEFLVPYRNALAALPPLLNDIKEMAEFGPPSRVQLSPFVNRLVELSALSMGNAAEVVRQRREAGAASANTIENGQGLVAEISQHVSKIVNLKENQIRAFNAKAQTADRLAEIFLLGAPLLSILMVILVVGRMVREIKRRRVAEALLNQANDSLEQRVAERTEAIRVESRRRAEIAATLNAVVEGSSLAIIEFDAARCITQWNHAATWMFGIPRDEAIGKPYLVIAREHGEACETVFDQCEAGEPVQRVAMRFEASDGRALDVSLSAVALYNSDERLRGFAFLMEDVTERLAIERQARSMQRLQSLGQLTGGIAHDFNNLLNSVIINLDLALDTTKDRGRADDFVKAALRSALRGTDLTGRLLTFARERSLKSAPVDVGNAISEFMSFMKRTLSEGIQISFASEPGIWPVKVDQSQLEDAMTNIALNARDAMPQGGTLSITAKNVEVGPGLKVSGSNEFRPGFYVELAFTDSGTGMSPQDLEHAFDPFFTTKEKGTGLGLSMVYGFVKASGGHVEITSQRRDPTRRSGGTTLRLWLPRSEASPANAEQGQSERVPRSAAGETLLVVEDQQDVRDAVVSALEALGYKTLVATSGEQAMEILEKGQRIDLIFSDIVMPGGMTGFDLIAWARQKQPNIKIILATGFAEMAPSGLTSLPDDVPVIQKPYRQAKLAEVIRRLLDGAAATS